MSTALRPAIVRALMDKSKAENVLAQKARAKGDKLDRNHDGGRDSRKIQELWYEAAIHMHTSLAILRYVGAKNMDGDIVPVRVLGHE